LDGNFPREPNCGVFHEIQKDSVFLKDPLNIIESESDFLTDPNINEIQRDNLFLIDPSNITVSEYEFPSDLNDRVSNNFQADPEEVLPNMVEEDRSLIMEMTPTSALKSKDLVFVFEEPLDAYYSQLRHKDRKDLLSLDCLDIQRLSYMKYIHVVTQPMDGVQVTYATNIDIPHYQVEWKQLKS
jgi:hypothetical protein